MRFDYQCPRCGWQGDRVQILLDEADQQFHTWADCVRVDSGLFAGKNRYGLPVKLKRLFAPTTSRAIVYGNDHNTSGGLPVGGPRERARYLKERGLVETGNEDISHVHRMAAEGQAAQERAMVKELHGSIMEEMAGYQDGDLFEESPTRDSDEFHDPDYASRRQRQLTGADDVPGGLIGVNVDVTPEDIAEVAGIVDSD